MASSDDEADTMLEKVSTFYFEDHNDAPISFAVLPVRWSDGECSEDAAAAETIFLHGTADNGLRKIYTAVKSWRFDLGGSRPEVWVLSKDNTCFRLDKPRRSFQDTIRTVLITLHCLHYARNHPDSSGEALWEHLARTLGYTLYQRAVGIYCLTSFTCYGAVTEFCLFLNLVYRFYQVRPSAKDLQDHVALIEEAIWRDHALAKSKVVLVLVISFRFMTLFL